MIWSLKSTIYLPKSALMVSMISLISLFSLLRRKFYSCRCSIWFLEELSLSWRLSISLVILKKDSMLYSDLMSTSMISMASLLLWFSSSSSFIALALCSVCDGRSLPVVSAWSAVSYFSKRLLWMSLMFSRIFMRAMRPPIFVRPETTDVGYLVNMYSTSVMRSIISNSSSLILGVSYVKT